MPKNTESGPSSFLCVVILIIGAWLFTSFADCRADRAKHTAQAKEQAAKEDREQAAYLWYEPVSESEAKIISRTAEKQHGPGWTGIPFRASGASAWVQVEVPKYAISAFIDEVVRAGVSCTPQIRYAEDPGRGF